MMKKIFFLLTIGFVLQVDGQDAVTNPVVDITEKVPPSPNGGSLGKFFDIPVNLGTGIPSIEIPLYTIKSGNINVPITLRYHASGVRVNEVPSWVGSGWNLKAGGSVIKSVNGLDDKDAVANTLINYPRNPQYNYVDPNYWSVTNLGFTSMTQAFDSLIHQESVSLDVEDFHRFFGTIPYNIVDGEADEYNFVTPSSSGSFFYNQKTEGYQFDQINGWKVENTGLAWTLHTNNGLRYAFANLEKSKNTYFERSESSLEYLTNGWQLDNIQDIINNKTVSFDYYLDSTHHRLGFPKWKKYQYVLPVWSLLSQGYDEIERKGNEFTVSAIYFDEGQVQFFRGTSDRLDGGPRELTEIRVVDSKNRILKKFLFSYTMLNANTNGQGDYNCTLNPYIAKRLFLTSVQEIDYDFTGTGYAKNPYIISYDTSVALPCRFSYAQDYWGYFNGKFTNSSAIPSFPNNTNPTISGANREVDSAYSKAGIIRKLQYPTGGSLSFVFEQNRYDSILLGGLRIKQITNYDSVGSKSLVTEYNYSGGNVTSEQLYPVYGYYYYHLTGGSGGGQEIHLQTTPVNPLFRNQGSPIIYDVVTKKQKGPDGDILSKHYLGNLELAPYNLNYQHLQGVPFKKFSKTDEYEGFEYKTELFKLSGANYSLVQVDSMEFSMLNNASNYVWNVQGAWYYPPVYSFVQYDGNDPFSGQTMNTKPSLNGYKLISDKRVLSKKFTKTKTPNGEIVQTQLYEYDKLNGNVKVTKTINSLGDTTIVRVKYPTDFNYTEASSGINFEIDKLIAFNAVALPIETIVEFKKQGSSNSTLKEAVLIQYDDLRIKSVSKVDENIPLSSFTQASNNVNGFYSDSRYRKLQEVLHFGDYTKPLLLDNNGSKLAYIWQSSINNPLAVVSNVSAYDVAYTSFDDQNSGNWTIPSTARNYSSAFNGYYSYYLGYGGITRSDLNSSASYVTTYWSANGSYSVSGSSGSTALKTIGSWTLYKHISTGVSSITISGSGLIDEVRLYPVGAQMNTFVYEPILGVSASVDHNSVSTFFEYRGIDRLFLVRDEQKNITKKYCYTYINQTEDCNVNTAASWVGTNITRCKPCAANTNYTSTTLQTEFRDLNPYSSTYNSSNWVDVAATCQSQQVWQDITDSVRCVKDTYQDNTGDQEKKQEDINPCSNTYGSTRWVNIGPNSTSCPLPNGTYAKLTYENVTYYSTYAVADIVVRFYSNAACTIPKSVSGLTVNYNVYNSCGSIGNNYQSSCTGTSKVIGSQVQIWYQEELYDYNMQPIGYQDCYVDYTLLTGTGYSIAP